MRMASARCSLSTSRLLTVINTSGIIINVFDVSGPDGPEVYNSVYRARRRLTYNSISLPFLYLHGPAGTLMKPLRTIDPHFDTLCVQQHDLDTAEPALARSSRISPL